MHRQSRLAGIEGEDELMAEIFYAKQRDEIIERIKHQIHCIENFNFSSISAKNQLLNRMNSFLNAINSKYLINCKK